MNGSINKRLETSSWYSLNVDGDWDLVDQRSTKVGQSFVVVIEATFRQVKINLVALDEVKIGRDGHGIVDGLGPSVSDSAVISLQLDAVLLQCATRGNKVEQVITRDRGSEDACAHVETFGQVVLHRLPVDDTATTHRLVPLHVEIDHRLLHTKHSDFWCQDYNEGEPTQIDIELV